MSAVRYGLDHAVRTYARRRAEKARPRGEGEQLYLILHGHGADMKTDEISDPAAASRLIKKILWSGESVTVKLLTGTEARARMSRRASR